MRLEVLHVSFSSSIHTYSVVDAWKLITLDGQTTWLNGVTDCSMKIGTFEEVAVAEDYGGNDTERPTDLMRPSSLPLLVIYTK